MNLLVLSYNVLAARHLLSARYPDSPAETLASEPRFERIAALVASFRADLVCLQEVETDCFAALSRHLGGLGYEGHHELRSPSIGEGCALFAKSSSVRLLALSRCDFRDAPAEGGSSHRFAQLAELEIDGRRFVLANTHLQWDPPDAPAGRRRGESQAHQLAAALDRLAGKDGAAIVCGDFNAGPESRVYRVFIESGFCAARNEGGETPTCQANGRLSEVDFVFHRGFASARPLPRVGLRVSTPMPGYDHPSDHVPVGADFDGDSDDLISDIAVSPAESP